MAGLSLSAQGTGALISAAGTFSNAATKRDAARVNAAYAREQAADARDRGELAAQRHGREVSQLKGQQRANLAARGVILTEGSPMEILASTDRLAAIDAAKIRETAARESYAHLVDAANYEAEAAASNPFLSTAGSLLTSASGIADRWSIYKQKGISPYGI